jgi:hypothetical protein
MSLNTPHSTLTAGLADACIAAALFESTVIAAASTIMFRSGRLPAPLPFALAAVARPPTLAKAFAVTSHTLDTPKYRLRLGDLVRVKSGGPMMMTFARLRVARQSASGKTPTAICRVAPSQSLTSSRLAARLGIESVCKSVKHLDE